MQRAGFSCRDKTLFALFAQSPVERSNGKARQGSGPTKTKVLEDLPGMQKVFLAVAGDGGSDYAFAN